MKLLKEALDQGTLCYAQGQMVKRLEQEFARLNDIEFAVGCSSGTAAIHSAMIATGVSPGDND